MSKRPRWERHWRNLPGTPKCGVCDQEDPWQLRYYVVGFRCSKHAPGVMAHD